MTHNMGSEQRNICFNYNMGIKRYRITLFMIVMFIIIYFTIEIYSSLFHYFTISNSSYSQAVYNEEVIHHSGAMSFIIMLPLSFVIFICAVIGLSRYKNFLVFGLYHKLYKIKSWHWAIALGGIVFIWFSIINKGLPRLEDDLAYIFQANLFSRGVRSLCTDNYQSLKSLLFWWWTTGDSCLYSFQIPGHSLMLTIGAFLNNFSYVCVIEAVGTGLATYRAAELLYGRRIATLTGLLFVTSPFIVSTFSSYSASCSVSFFVSIGLWFWAEIKLNPSMIKSSFIGIALGLTFWVRPTSSVFISIPIFIEMLLSAYKQRSYKLCLYLWVSLLLLIVICTGYIYYCSSITGNFSVSPGDIYSQRVSSDEMSVMNILKCPSDQVLRLSGFLYSLLTLNIYLCGSPISLLFIGVYVIVHRKTRVDWCLMLCCFMMFAFYAPKERILIWYYFELMPVLMIFSARSIVGLYDQCRTRLGNEHKICFVLTASVIAGIFTSTSVVLPMTLAKQYFYTKYFNSIPIAVQEAVGKTKTLVFLTKTIPSPLDKHLLSRNDPFLDGDIVYLRMNDDLMIPGKLPDIFRGYRARQLEVLDNNHIRLKALSCGNKTAEKIVCEMK